MNYLGRPVFEFDIDWKNPVNKQFAFDLRETTIGFGSEFFTPLQAHSVQGYRFEVILDGGGVIADFDDFFAALHGRLAGFWLPAPFQAMKITGAVSSTRFDMADQNFRDTWNDHPDIHLWFTRPGQPPRIGKVSAVAAQGAGERVTLADALNPAPGPTDTVWRLHYVRLIDDTERGRFQKEGCQTREVRVVELAQEYAAYETGTLPIYLYHFFCPEPVNAHWRYTSFAANVVSGNELFTKYPISHGALRRSVRWENEKLDIEAAFDANHPFAKFLPLPPMRPVQVEVSKCSYADPDTAEVLFTGIVRKVDDADENGGRLIGRADSWLGILSRKFPRMMLTKQDNFGVFDANTNGIERANFETLGTVTAVEAAAFPPTVTIDLVFTGAAAYANWRTADWFAGGMLEAGLGEHLQVRTITRSTPGSAPALTLEINAPLDIEVGTRVQLIPGYDGEAATRRDKFRDFDNFGGFVAIPENNLSLQAVDQSASQGDKK